MRNFLKIFLVVVASLAAGVYLHKCQSPSGNVIPSRGVIVADTITVYDTIPYIEPASVHSRQTGSKEITIPTSDIDRGFLSPKCPGSAKRSKNLPDIGADTFELKGADVEAIVPDSLTLQLPITQNVYEGEDYKAFVSGVYPSLDSLFVYPRREIVTIKKPPKRWHIGPTIGFGYTPHGFESFFGISLTYSIIGL